MATIYKNIKRIAEQKKVQQKEIAIALKVGVNTVNNWFQGKTSMKAEQIPIIAQLLKVTVEELYKDTYSNKIELSNSGEAMHYYSCPDCIDKQKTIDKIIKERDELRVELLDLYRTQKGKDCG